MKDARISAVLPSKGENVVSRLASLARGNGPFLLLKYRPVDELECEGPTQFEGVKVSWQSVLKHTNYGNQNPSEISLGQTAAFAKSLQRLSEPRLVRSDESFRLHAMNVLYQPIAGILNQI